MTKILAAIDFSSLAQKTLTAAVVFANRPEASLYVLHSLDIPDDYPLPYDASPKKGYKNSLAREAEKKIGELMRPHAIGYEPLICSGDPVEAVRNSAEKVGADLVVVAARDIKWISGIFHGRIVERLCRSVSVPLLVVRPPSLVFADMPSKITACCDLTEDDAPVLRLASLLLRNFSAELSVVHAVDQPCTDGDCNFLEMPYERHQDLMMANRAYIMKKRSAETLKKETAADFELLRGHPGEAVAEFARQKKIGLLIVGVKQKSRHEKALIGSTTEWLVRFSPCPVITVPSMYQQERFI